MESSELRRMPRFTYMHILLLSSALCLFIALFFLIVHTISYATGSAFYWTMSFSGFAARCYSNDHYICSPYELAAPVIIFSLLAFAFFSFWKARRGGFWLAVSLGNALVGLLILCGAIVVFLSPPLGHGDHDYDHKQSVSMDGHVYHVDLEFQRGWDDVSIDLHIFQCDFLGLFCHRVYSEDITADFRGGRFAPFTVSVERVSMTDPVGEMLQLTVNADGKIYTYMP